MTAGLAKKGTETVEGNCVVCNARRRHAIRTGSGNTEYFECLKCGNRVDVKGFVFDDLDALEGPRTSESPGRVGARGRKARRRA